MNPELCLKGSGHDPHRREWPIVWHDEAQRLNDLGLLDPPTFCACDDCLCVTPPGGTCPGCTEDHLTDQHAEGPDDD